MPLTNCAPNFCFIKIQGGVWGLKIRVLKLALKNLFTRTVNSQYLKLEIYSKVLICPSKFSGPEVPQSATSGPVSFLLLLIQEGQLSVTGESMCIKHWLTELLRPAAADRNLDLTGLTAQAV